MENKTHNDTAIRKDSDSYRSKDMTPVDIIKELIEEIKKDKAGIGEPNYPKHIAQLEVAISIFENELNYYKECINSFIIERRRKDLIEAIELAKKEIA